ncbi:hypothetical protein CYFUS_001040 [Cystobacter fuscus]|uniref:Uncharacterized protein n=1 Tax=Cystobacter fuscus TaxID=43 RepID=A0A250IXJ0_9BACT|nr:hypothetical protein CYFUS_001040 [Cystobacter fuscus]
MKPLFDERELDAAQVLLRGDPRGADSCSTRSTCSVQEAR